MTGGELGAATRGSPQSRPSSTASTRGLVSGLAAFPGVARFGSSEAQVSPDWQPPAECAERLGDYVLGPEIRKASLKGVQLRQARRVRDNLPVCIKILHKDLMSEMVTHMVCDEAKIFGLLRGDSGCVAMIECIETPTAICVVLEDFVTGYTDLQALLTSHPRLTEVQALYIFLQLTEFVSRLHAKNIAHRDLKLPHIVVDSRLRVKVTDFSLGTVLPPSSKGFVRDQRGSPAYISPEVLSGRPYSALQSDVWSVGVILYKLLTGRFPFNDKNHKLLFDKIKGGAFPMPPEGTVSHDTIRLLRHTMHMSPAERPTAEALHTLARSMLAQHSSRLEDEFAAGAHATSEDQAVPEC